MYTRVTTDSKHVDLCECVLYVFEFAPLGVLLRKLQISDSGTVQWPVKLIKTDWLVCTLDQPHSKVDRHFLDKNSCLLSAI